MVVAICLIMSTVVSVAAGTTAQWLSFVAAGLSAFGAIQESLVKLFITDFTTKKKKKYHDQVQIMRKYLDKMFIAYLDATAKNSDEGRKISVDELKLYLGLTYEMDKELMESSMEHQEILSNFRLQSELQNAGDTTLMQDKIKHLANLNAGTSGMTSIDGNHANIEEAESGTSDPSSMSAAAITTEQNGEIESATDPFT